MPKTKKNDLLLGGLSEKELKDYAQFFEKNKLEHFELTEGGVTLTIEREKASPAAVSVSVPAPAPAEAPSPEEPPPKKNYKEIKSPIVGTFYTTPAPDAAPFVRVGDRVDSEMSVCIVEAMKVMNEIKSGVSGVIVEILVQSGDLVQADQVLMHVE